MASQAERDCLSNPNFAVICSFMDRYAETLGLPEIGYKDLQEWVEDAKNVSPLLIDLHVRLLRRIHKKFSNVTADRWERGVVKFCYKYSNVDAWEIERFGYKLAKISTKLTLLKNLMESQFDCNNKFKDKINETPIEDLRFRPVGRDKDGMAYWYFLDKELNLRVYREHQDDVDSESWELVCRNREDLSKLITGLEYGTHIKLDRVESSDQSEPVSDFNEDSRDSFKQNTPHGPSPLTIKQEPGEGDAPTGDTKQSIVLKISKSDIQSPSKMLKDKFVKEKGSEIKKIMCKLKEEGLVDTDNDDEDKLKDKTDKVDGPVNSTVNEDKDLVKCEIKNEQEKTKVNLEEASKEITEEVPNNNETVSNEGIASIKTENKGQEISDIKTNMGETIEENKNNDTGKDSKLEQKELRPLKTIKEDIDTKDQSKPVAVSLPDHEVGKETDLIEDRDTHDSGTNNFDDKTEDVLCSEQNKTCESEKDKEKPEIPQTESICKSDTLSSTEQATETSEIKSCEVINDPSVEKECIDTADILNVKKLEQAKVASESAGNGSVSSKTSVKNVCDGRETIDTSVKDSNSENNINEIKAETQLKDKIDDTIKECQTATAKDEMSGSSEECEPLCRKDEMSESQVTEQFDNKSDKGSEELASEKQNTLENSLEHNAKAEGEGEHASENVQTDESKQISESAKLEDFENKSDKVDTKVKKARKRKNDEMKSEVVNSSTDEEIDNESVHPSKRTIKTAVRKSPNKATEVDTKEPELPVEESEESSITCEKGEAENEVQTDKHEKEESGYKAACEEKESEKSVCKSDEKEVSDNVEKTQKKELEKLSENKEELEIETKKKKDMDNEIEKKKDIENETEKKKGIENETEEKKDTKNVIEKNKHIESEIEKKEELENEKEEAKMEENDESGTETANKSQRKVKGLVAHSRRSKSKAQKRQAETSDDMEPAEPASKKSKLRGRVSSRGRGKRRGVNFDSSSSDDDIPLSKMAGHGRGSNSKGKAGPVVGQQHSKAVKDPPKKKKVEEEQEANNSEAPEIPPDLSEEDTGRRRSARVRNMRARKKSPSPDYVPSGLEESDEEFHYDDDDDEFTMKSKKRKKKEPKEVVEEIPKGRNALRHEAKTKKNGPKVVEEEDEEAACVKCLRSHQPEWILLCDKCDAGYHTACLRPPLMIIPDGDWYCPPCEHTMLKEKLEDNLKTLDQAILKNDRLIRRKERLAFVSVSLDNVLKEPDPVEVVKGRRQRKPNYKESNDESESGTSSGTGSSESTSESESSEGERSHGQKAAKPKYIQRTCRTKKSVSYRFEEFDELIMDAIEEDLSIPKEPKPKKVKPPGISRGKDMSNILGVSDEEVEKKPPRKRKPRLTELDEDVDDDDTDDYQLSETSDVSDATKSYESEEVSEDSIESAWRHNSRSTRKSRRKGGRNRKYRDDFVVDSDFESDEDSNRRSKRRPRRGKVNYKEINSDETEVEDADDSFHSSELSDSDFESKRTKRIERKKKQTSKERPRSGKRQRIRRVSSSSGSSETESDESTPKKKIGKKPPSKTARYDSDETDQSVENARTKTLKKKKFQKLPDMSESEAEETESTESSETEVSDSDEKKAKPKQNKKNVIKSESEGEENDEDKTDIEKENESHDSEDSEGSGWEEISVESDSENVAKLKDGKTLKSSNINIKHRPKAKADSALELSSKDENVTPKKKLEDSEIPEATENVHTDNKVSDEQKVESDHAETMEETVNLTNNKEDKSAIEVTPTKKKRGRKSKAEKGDDEGTTTEEVTPKKRGRKPKPKPDPSEVSVDETPVKRKRGRNVKSDTAAEVEFKKSEQLRDNVETDESVIVENKKTALSEKTGEVSEKDEESQKLGQQTSDEKTEAETLQTVEKNKDDSPLSARNKQNAPVGVVKPEVRQGVIVENKQVIDSRLNENRTGENSVNPLQGMRALAMGSQNVPGTHPSSFTPYSQSNFGNQNMPGYMGQQGFQGYPHGGPPYSQGGPGPNHPYQGPQGMPPGAPSQYPPNQGPLSPNSFQQHGTYMGQMQQGPPGFYPGNFRPPLGHPEGFGPPNPHGSQSPSFQHGQNPQYYHPHQNPYHGQGYPEQPGHYMGPQAHISHPQSGPGPYPGMPYNYPNMPQQGLPRPGYSPAGPQTLSPSQPIRPQTRLAGPTQTQQGSSPNPRPDNEPPNRGFMMDNILKPSPEGPTNDVEDSAEVSDIDRYTSFLCKTE